MKKLYKFRSLASNEEFNTVKEIKKIIKTGKFYFSDWKDMNDPMEGYFSFSHDGKEEKIATEIVYQKNKLKICSFADSWQNILMWSNYADNHRGICIEVKVDQNDTIKLNYEREIPKMQEILNENSNNITETAKKILSTKVTLWEYENEIRIFKSSKGEHNVGKITKVYFGIKCEQYKEKLTKLCKDNDIPVQDLEINFDTNKMKLKRINKF